MTDPAMRPAFEQWLKQVAPHGHERDHWHVWQAAWGAPHPTLNSGADREAIARSGTFLGYRDANGFEMHCANAFCPDQAKCNQGCINPVPRRALPRAVQGGEVESDEVLALQIHRIPGCQVGSERCKNIIKWYRSKAPRAVQGGAEREALDNSQPQGVADV